MNIDNESHIFETPIKHNHSGTEPSSNNNVSVQVPLGYDPIQCQKYHNSYDT